jgi:hypothetical protein
LHFYKRPTRSRADQEKHCGGSRNDIGRGPAEAPRRGRWHTIVCIASGPSLTTADCEKIKNWREQKADRGVIVVNRLFEWCPWADLLYAMDSDFWRRYLMDVLATFDGALVSAVYTHPGVHAIQLGHPENSGAGAIALAHHLGAKKIVLVGYDASWRGEKRHCHDDYPKGMGNAGSVDKWPAHFEKLSKSIESAQIINCSRESALSCFPRAPLETVLECT